MLNWPEFAARLSRKARNHPVAEDSVLFGAGLNISSVSFLEFVMELEEDAGLDIDVESLDASIRTAGQLYDRIFAAS